MLSTVWLILSHCESDKLNIAISLSMSNMNSVITPGYLLDLELWSEIEYLKIEVMILNRLWYRLLHKHGLKWHTYLFQATDDDNALRAHHDPALAIGTLFGEHYIIQWHRERTLMMPSLSQYSFMARPNCIFLVIGILMENTGDCDASCSMLGCTRQSLPSDAFHTVAEGQRRVLCNVSTGVWNLV